MRGGTHRRRVPATLAALALLAVLLAGAAVVARSPANGGQTVAAGGARRAAVPASPARVAARSIVPSVSAAASFTPRRSRATTVPRAAAGEAAARTTKPRPRTPLPPALSASTGTGEATPDAAPTVSRFLAAATCPCTLFAPSATPAILHLSTSPGTLELGVKLRVDEPTLLTAIRFWKDSQETSAHTGRVWSEAGTKLAEVAFASETAAGWQHQALATPLDLEAGKVYVVSVNINQFWATTQNGLASEIVSGPIRTVVGGNGVYADAANSFPTSSYNSSNYFVDLEVVRDGELVPTVTGTVPAREATDVSPTTTVRATFSQRLDPATVSGSSFMLTGPAGTVAASVAYDDPTRTAVLTPAAPLTLGTRYTAHLAAGITALGGRPMGTPYSWAFTIVSTAPGPPTVTARTPGADACCVATDTKVTATFSRSMDPATLTSASFTLTPAGGPTPVAAAVTYDATTKKATLTPSAPLVAGTQYSAALTTAVKAIDGAALAAPETWTFTTVACPCSLFPLTAKPANVNVSTRNGRSGDGPFSLELGVKIKVDQPTLLSAIGFYKDTQETGQHTATVWTSDGALKLAQVPFAGETASGWQTQALPAPLSLEPGNVYVVSIGVNQTFGMTVAGLSAEIVSGPLRSVVGANGVYADAAGQFPKQTYSASNYFVDVVTGVNAPTVIARTPAPGATEIARGTAVEARFSRPLDPATVAPATFTLRKPDGSAVTGSVTYVAATDTAVFTPSALLDDGTTYTAKLTTGIRAADGVPLGSEVAWSFTTRLETPTVTLKTPGDGELGVDPLIHPSATFSRPMDAATVTSSSFTLETAGSAAVAASVVYDSASRKATLTPSAPLANATTYTARLATTIKSSDGAPLASPVSWSFSTAAAAVRINAGGGAYDAAGGQRFGADAYSTGGSTLTSSAAIAGTSDPVLYQDERWGNFNYAIPVTNGTYDVRFHFVELYYPFGSCIGSRVFSMDVIDTPGGPDVANLDVCAAAGGGNTALVRTVAGVQVWDGVLNVQSVYGSADDPELAAIEVVPASGPPPAPGAPTVTAKTPADGATGVATGVRPAASFSRAMDAASITSSSFSLTPNGGSPVAASVSYDTATATATLTPPAALAPSTTYTAKLDTSVRSSDGVALASPVTWTFTTTASGGGSTVRINTGGPAYTTGTGATFAADGSFTGGSTYSTTSTISGTSEPALYQNERWGSWSYAIPVSNGTYDVKLHFAETYYGTSQPGGAGKRVFSVELADTAAAPDLKDLDIYAEVGANAALVKTVAGVTVGDGVLNVAGVYGAADDPTIAAIEVVPATPPPPSAPTVTARAPVDGAAGVSTATGVTATFSRAMDAATITSSSFTLKRPDGSLVAASVAYDASTLQATLTPSAALAGETAYTARLEPAIAAADGMPLAAPVSWSFTTGPAPGTSTVKVNAGGAVYGSFEADAYFTGGQIATWSTPVGGTADPVLYQDERWGGWSYAIPVANGLYDVKLHFAELYFGPVQPGGAGKRVFSVELSDTAATPDIKDLDIYAEVGSGAALVKTIGNVNVSDGVLNVAGVYGAADDPTIAAIEVVPASAAPPAAPTVTARTPADGATGVEAGTPVTATFSRAMEAATVTSSSFTLKRPDGSAVSASVAYDAATLRATLTPSAALAATTTYTAQLQASISAADGRPLAAPVSWSFTTGNAAGTSTVRINAGGPDGDGFQADVYFSGGGVNTTASAISGTTNQGLYQNERWGSWSYAIPVQNGAYDVKLHFAEIFFGTAQPGGAGKRVFSVDLGDTASAPDLKDLDIYAEVGANAALVKTISGVNVTDGVLNLAAVYGAADDPTIAAIEVVPSSAPAPPPPSSVTGVWADPVPWPLVAVHMSLLPNGDVLAIDGFDAAVDTQRIWKPSADTFTAVPYGRNLFCSAHLLLPDGRTFLAGGHVQANEGLADTTLFDSTTNTWTRGQDMAVARWYPTATQLADGRVLVFSGDNIVQDRPDVPPPFSDASVDSLPEIYDPKANSWTALTGARLTSPLYPFLFLLTDGRVFNAGPDTVTRILDPAAGTWSTVGTSPIDGMSAVLYRPDKIMKSGSWADPDFNGPAAYTATNKTAVIDLGAASPAWRETAPMSFARSYHTLTLLPDGKVLASGGGTSSDGVDLTRAVLPAEIWDPDTETWTTVDALTNGRLYHSTAMLLADGRVLMAGGGRFPNSPAVDQWNAEIYSPPYLFKGPRPTIASAPSTVGYGDSFTIDTPDADRIASVSLIRTPSVTHALDMNQRFMRLTFAKVGSLTVDAPANARLAPPGYYMLFVVDTNGVPSVASFIRIPPSLDDLEPPSAPGSLVATAGSAQVDLTWTAATDNVAVTRYNVHRSTTPGFTPAPANRIAQVTGTSYADSGRPEGTYYYRVTAQDASGNVGSASNEASAVVGSGPGALVAAYSFDAGTGTTAADATGNGHAGAISGATWSPSGKFGGALSFDGIDDWVTVADADALDLTTGMTLEAWVNPSALGTAWRTAIIKEGAGALVYALYANIETSRPSAHVFTSGEADARGTAQVALNAWTHVAATYDGSTLRLYVDGAPAGSTAVTGAMGASAGALRIGGNGLWGEWFAGLIDEVRIYSGVLSAAEIQADMNTSVGS